MPNPSPTWNTVPVIGTWRNIDGTPKQGNIKFTIADRVYAVTDDIIFPGNASLTIALDSQGSISTLFPASDDPDIFPNGWTVKVEEKFTDNSGLSYYMEPKLADMPVGVNLRQIVVPAGSPSVPATAIVAAIEKATADTQAIADASAGSATAASASATAAAASATAAATSETNAAASAAQAEAAAQTVTGTVNETRQINTGPGLTGGGDLTADRTLAADFGTTAGTVAEGDDARIVGAAQKAANLSDLADASTARDNLGLGTAAVTDEAFLLDRANHTGTESLDVTTDGATRVAMTPAERTKLAGVATGATANQTDTYLLDRTNHTGTESLDVTTDSSTRVAMTPAERTKLTSVATGATANATDAQLRDRSTHTGTLVLSGNTMADVFVVANGATAPATLADGTVIVELA